MSSMAELDAVMSLPNVVSLPMPDQKPGQPDADHWRDLIAHDDAVVRYAETVEGVVMMFEFELCDLCGGDFEDHIISPDMFGNAHAWCQSSPDAG